MEIDYRKNQKVIATFILEDKGQDFTEIDVLENGVILGNSIMFSDGRLSIVGVGAKNGQEFWTFNGLKEDLADRPLATFYIYIKNTKDKKEPLPWEAKTLNYKIIDVKKTMKPNRFLISNNKYENRISKTRNRTL